MTFNKEHFWYSGTKWVFIKHMSTEALISLQNTISRQKMKSDKIDRELESRYITQYGEDKILEINGCIAIEETTKEEEVIIKENIGLRFRKR